MIGGAPAFYETEQSLTITREIYFMDVQSTHVNFNMTHGTMNSLAIILQSTDLFYSSLLLPP